MIKKLIFFTFSVVMCLFLISYNQQKEDISKNNISVEILSNNTSDSYKGMPIGLMPKLNGEYGGNIQYRWILEDDSDTIGFSTEDKEHPKEIINEGGHVQIHLYGEDMPANSSLSGFKVKLQVEDKDTLEVIAKDDMEVKNILGDYAITRYSAKDIENAINCVKNNFQFPSTTLKRIWYNEEASDKYINSMNELINLYGRENIIAVFSDLYVDKTGGNPVLASDSTYSNYTWVLARDSEKSKWKVVDQGY